MSSQSNVTRSLLALVAAVAMSAVAVGSAVGPVQAIDSPLKVQVNA